MRNTYWIFIVELFPPCIFTWLEKFAGGEDDDDDEEEDDDNVACTLSDSIDDGGVGNNTNSLSSNIGLAKEHSWEWSGYSFIFLKCNFASSRLSFINRCLSDADMMMDIC